MQHNQLRIALVGLTHKRSALMSRSLAIENLAAYLRHVHGATIDVRLWDLQFNDTESLIEEMRQFSPNIVGISMPIGTVTVGEHLVSRLITDRPDLTLVIGGLVATNATEDLCQRFPGALVVVGEGERALCKIVECHLRQEPLAAKTVPGVSYQDATGNYHHTPPLLGSEFGGWADDLWDHLLATRGQVLIEGSRGCLGTCSFCSSCNLHPQGWIPRPVDDVVNEIVAIYARGVRWVFFVDDDFVGHSWQHALELGSKIGQHFPELTFGISLRADSLILPEGVDNLRFLQRQGLVKVLVGMESGSSSQLRRFGKRANVNANERAMHVLRAVPHITFSLGFLIDPLISRAELRESVEFVLKNDLSANINHPFGTLDVHKGSRFETLTQRAGIQKSFDLNSLTWTCSYADPGIEQIMQTVKSIEAHFLPVEIQLTDAFRGITRAPTLRPSDIEQRDCLENDLNKLKKIQFQLLYHLVCNESITTSNLPLNELRAWCRDVEAHYGDDIPALSHSAQVANALLATAIED